MTPQLELNPLPPCLLLLSLPLLPVDETPSPLLDDLPRLSYPSLLLPPSSLPLDEARKLSQRKTSRWTP